MTIDLSELRKDIFGDFPLEMTPMARAVEIQNRTKYVVGWYEQQSTEPVFAKLQEEIGELQAALNEGDSAHIIEELGDVLFVATHMAQHLGIDPDMALNGAIVKFKSRMEYIETALNAQGLTMNKSLQPVMESLWGDSKKA